MVKPNNKTKRSKQTVSPPDPQSTEKKILVAAREEFIARGIGGARMQAIADRAGVNKALVHYYFRSKEKLYGAVLSDIFRTVIGGFREQMAKQGDSDDLRSLLRTIVTVYVKTLRNNPDFARFMVRELADGGSHLPELVEVFLSSFADIPQRIFSLLVKETSRGRIRRIPPVQFALNIIGMSVFAFFARPMVNAINEKARLNLKFDDGFFDERIDAIVTMACDGIFKERRA
jgi:TetR/AcrR family transcriptional regulator